MAVKIERKKLQDLLVDILSKSATFKFIEGLNPFLISLNGLEYYIYIKNLSSAYFTNPDVWRVQLPIREDFESIRQTNIPFILLGYDADNDTYATWNPYWTKQRLNVAESVSFYSRYSLHEQVRDNRDFLSLKLQNDGEVVAFPRYKTAYYIVNIEQFFPEMSDYVAIGSKKRAAANEAYRLLNDGKNIDLFASHLQTLNLQEKTAHNYSKAIKKLIFNGHFSRNRRLFLACDSLTEYMDVIESFIAEHEINRINESWQGTYSAALRYYIEFLNKLTNNDDIVSKAIIEDEILSETDGVIEEGNEVDDIDWETQFTDNNGKLTRIANPSLLELLRDELDTEYKSLPVAYNIVEEFYGDRFSSMELKDWNRLFDKIDWNNPYYEHIPGSCFGKRKTHILKVTFPDGTIIQERVVSKTLIKVIEYAGPNEVQSLGIMINNINLVSDSVIPSYERSQKKCWQWTICNDLLRHKQKTKNNRIYFISFNP